MEVDPPIAIATHRREHTPLSEATTAAHLDAWRRGESGEASGEGGEGGDAAAELAASERRVQHMLWPVILGERMLDALGESPTPLQARQAILACRWPATQEEADFVWSPTTEVNTAEQAHATMREAARQRSHVRAARAVAALSELAGTTEELTEGARAGRDEEEHDEKGEEKVMKETAEGESAADVALGGSAMLPWLLERVPVDTPTIMLATALLARREGGSAGAPGGARVVASGSCERGLARRSDGMLLAAFASYSHGTLPLLQALSGLSLAERLRLAHLIIFF